VAEGATIDMEAELERRKLQMAGSAAAIVSVSAPLVLGTEGNWDGQRGSS
jgi:hypothetical protein